MPAASKNSQSGQQNLMTAIQALSKKLPALQSFASAGRESTSADLPLITAEDKERQALLEQEEEEERRRRAEYLKATFPSAISASETYTGPGQISQEEAKQAGYLAGEFASDIIPGGRIVKGLPDFAKAALVPTPMNLGIGASRLIPTQLGGPAVTAWLKRLKRANDVGTAIGSSDPDIGQLAIAAGALGGKKIPYLGSATKGLTREEDPLETPVLSEGTMSVLNNLLGGGQAVADPLPKEIRDRLRGI